MRPTVTHQCPRCFIHSGYMVRQGDCPPSCCGGVLMDEVRVRWPKKKEPLP